MKNSERLSDAHVLLYAAQATSEGDLDTLLNLARWRHDLLSTTLIYRLLLSFYPTDTSDHSSVVEFLRSLNEASPLVENPTFDPSISSLSPSQALRRCRSLNLRSIPAHTTLGAGNEQASFAIAWAKRLEQVDGAIQPAAEFVEAFIEQNEELESWYHTYLVPMLRLQYEYYPDADGMITLDRVEHLSGSGGIKSLLQYAEWRHDPFNVARDLEHVVSPWIQGASAAKRRKVEPDHQDESVTGSPWESVYDWMMVSSRSDFGVTGKAYMAWSGPETTEESTEAGETARYAQNGVAMIYGCSETSTEAHALCAQMLNKAAGLAGLKTPIPQSPGGDISVPVSFVNEVDETDFLLNSLMARSNKLTQVTEASVQLLAGVLMTAKILTEYGLPWTTSDLARVCMFGSERRQKDELRRLLQHIPIQTRKAIDWRSVREHVLWLRSWRHATSSNPERQSTAFFSRLSIGYAETQLLDVLLKGAQYSLVKEIFLDSSSTPLSKSEIEARVVASILEAYDNATNGNRDRGGIKRAGEILRAFRPLLPESSTLTKLEYLIKATHSLSFYQLKLQHGIPFKPVTIRVLKDPLTLLEKVLEQDSRAYTKLDDLLDIGRNLVRAHLPNAGNCVDEPDSLEVRTTDAEHRITYAAIMAALATHDFDTAYAYITTRLHTLPEQLTTAESIDDTSWRAAYAAGRYRPNSSPKSLTARIDSLVQRMELLSRALMLAPSGEALSGILATWRRYEEELDGLKGQAVEEEREHDARADASLPGAFGIEDRDADAAETKRAMARRAGPAGSGPSYEEEAPLGLFDVARGAASALRKSAAFPLGSTGLRDLKISSGSMQRQDPQREQASSPTSDDGTRMRKRDMVASMVGSGLGWVLGAQPQDRAGYRDDD